jgi:cellobiose phosphorylase
VSGATERATKYLKKYSRTRLLGDHVPYAIEAWPEGEQRHLSAESGLYARIITEGLFGIRPTGFKTFETTPRLPKDWNTMSLKKIKSFGSDFDINVERGAKEGMLNVTVVNGEKTVCKKTVKEGASISVRL